MPIPFIWEDEFVDGHTLVPCWSSACTCPDVCGDPRPCEGTWCSQPDWNSFLIQPCRAIAQCHDASAPDMLFICNGVDLSTQSKCIRADPITQSRHIVQSTNLSHVLVKLQILNKQLQKCIEFAKRTHIQMHTDVDITCCVESAIH